MFRWPSLVPPLPTDRLTFAACIIPIRCTA
jgi:hypothetical protein